MSLNRPYISSFLDEFVRRLVINGIDVSLYVPRPPGRDGLNNRNGMKVHRAIGPLGFATFVAELITNHSTIVHVQRPNTYSTPFIMIAHLLNRPVAVTIHRAEVLEYHRFPWSFLRRFVLRIVDIAICVSHSTRRLAIKLGCPPERAVVIYNTLNQERFKPRALKSARHLLKLPMDEDLLLYVGDLRREKGCASLLRAFALLQEPCALLIVGDGPLRYELVNLANSLSIGPKVSFIGRLPHDSEKLPLYYNAADVFVLPSITEGHSLALLEALASGVPAVATRVGGNSETIVEGINGVLVNPEDVTGLQAGLERLLGSRELRQRMRAGARDNFVQRFGEAKHLAQMIDLYRTLLTPLPRLSRASQTKIRTM